MMHGNQGKIEYWQDNIDKRKMLLLFISHIWVVVLGVIAGMLAGALIYVAYHTITDKVTYQGYSEFYLDFATDEKGDAYQWYNGYTWTGLMSAEPIVSSTLEALSGTDIDVSRIEQDTIAEIKSDIRVLRVTFTDSDADVCAKLQKATENSLVLLGSSVKEFISIEVIKTVTPEKVKIDSRMFQAILLGALAGLVITLILMWIIYILDERVMTLMDLEGLGVPVLGISFKNSDEKFAKFMASLCEHSTTALVDESALDIDGIYRLNVCEVQESLDESICDNASMAQAVIIEVPYKKVNRSMCRLVINTLNNVGTKIVGIRMIDASNKFYKAYYALGK